MAWIFWGLIRLLQHPYPVLVLVSVVAGACLLWALRVRERAQRLAAPPEAAAAIAPDQLRRDRWFNLINVGQWVVILVAANVFNNLGLARWVAPMAILVVGLHFLPLAPLLRVKAHYLTGAALVLIAVLYPLLTPTGPESGIGPLLTGAALWASALWALRLARV